MRNKAALLVILAALLVPVAGQAKPEESKDREVRTLEAIKIEGEIAIPQVLFITSRDHPRHRDQLRERYRPTAVQIGEEAVLPHRLRALKTPPKSSQ